MPSILEGDRPRKVACPLFHTKTEIADYLGIHHATVSRRLRRHEQADSGSFYCWIAGLDPEDVRKNRAACHL